MNAPALKITSKKSGWHTEDTKLINFGYVIWNDCKFEHSYNGPKKVTLLRKAFSDRYQS